jgi:hypothetical protein
MLRKAQKLEIVDGRPTLQAEVLRDHRLHLIEEQLRRYAAEHQERVLEPGEQRPHVPAVRSDTTATASTRTRPAARSLSPREAELREVHLGLAASRCFEAHRGLGRRRGRSCRTSF